MKTLTPVLRASMSTRAHAEAFIRSLTREGLSFHFDSPATECLAGLLSPEDCEFIDGQIESLYSVWEGSGADMSNDCPIGYALLVMNWPEGARYACHWGEGYIEPGDAEHGAEFFSESNGYEVDHRHKLQALRVGESADLSDLSGHHTVTRLPDRAVTVRTGDVVGFLPQWRDAGDEAYTFVAIEDEGNGYVRVTVAESTLAIRPIQTVECRMIETVNGVPYRPLPAAAAAAAS